jgi:hypothetical protein
MSCKAYFVRINTRRDQEALAKLLKALECPGESPNNGWFNWCARVTKRMPDPGGTPRVRGSLDLRRSANKFGYKKGDLVAAVTADNPYLDEWFLTAKVARIPYFTMLEQHPREQTEKGSKALDFEALKGWEYEEALVSNNLRNAIGYIGDSVRILRSHIRPGKNAWSAPIFDEGGIDLQKTISEVARHYMMLAIKASDGNKSKAARLLGLPSYQTLDNWMKKHGVVS